MALKVGDKGYVVMDHGGRREPSLQDAEVVKVARKYATLNIPSWSPHKVDMETGYVHEQYSSLRFYTVEQWELHKAALTRAKNQGNHAKVIAVCDQAFNDMDAHGYPDDWALFERARCDAEIAIRYAR